ncbi:MAG: PEP-CTERM sorting domain-containing protein, partial [Candidatus Nealsonbacteria bacterium]|nr:PEP-CTERM sorting domain-containing protein [Candidatus Nealsonbacteria bacterium]
VWTTDWNVLRANFGNKDYTVGGAAAVPEPGTIAMLLSALAVLGWRRRRGAGGSPA